MAHAPRIAFVVRKPSIGLVAATWIRSAARLRGQPSPWRPQWCSGSKKTRHKACRSYVCGESEGPLR
jgi:hypothetical protein